MAYRIPAVSELAASFKSKVETELNQTVPTVARAFVRVVAVAYAMLVTGLYKFAAERVAQCLAILATGTDLDRLGAQYGLTRTPAASAVIEATLPASSPSAVVPATCTFVGVSNGIRYFLDTSYTPTGAFIYLTMGAELAGAGGNLDNGQTLNSAFQVPGAGNIATVTGTVTTGADAESDDDFRVRVLDAIRNPGGGGNMADYRRWALEAAGVRQVYPQAGKPSGTSAPPDRTVWVEADASIDPDGIAPTSLLDDVRDVITTDPVSGEPRQPLGLTDETLYIESITRRSFYVDVRGLFVESSLETQAKAAISTALTEYFASTKMFVDGLDFPGDRNDTITAASVGGIVTAALSTYGGSCQTVAFGFFPGDTLLQYTLGSGELGKLGGVSYS